MIGVDVELVLRHHQVGFPREDHIEGGLVESVIVVRRARWRADAHVEARPGPRVEELPDSGNGRIEAQDARGALPQRSYLRVGRQYLERGRMGQLADGGGSPERGVQ